MSEKATAHRARSGYSTADETGPAVDELIAQVGSGDAAAVVFFSSPSHNSALVCERLAEHFPTVPVIGCTSAGEFDSTRMDNGGISAIVLPPAIAHRAATAIADFHTGVDSGIRSAVRSVESQLGIRLRDADPQRYVGLVLIDGLHATEERVNEILGNVAPLMSFVGGSAGDDLKNVETRVFSGTTAVTYGASLLVLDLAVPHTIVKTCSFEPAGHTFSVTRADVITRTVWQLNDRPAAEVYAEALGMTVDQLDFDTFASRPVGLMIDGQPWIRSVQMVVDGVGLKLHCQLLEGMDVDLMRHTDLVQETAVAMRDAVDRVGGTASGAVLFDCSYRKLRVESEALRQPYIASLGAIPAAGFHTYGETWLDHMNCTLTGVVFG